MRSIVSSRVHSSPPSSSIRASAALVASSRALSSSRSSSVPSSLHAEPADQRRQRQALQHERHKNHREGQKIEQVALREVQRQRERRGERDRAAHARPSRRSCAAATRATGALDSRAGRSRGSTNTSEWLPHEPREHDRGADRRRVAEQHVERLVEASRIAGSCSPISMNRNALSRNTSSSHMPKPCRRVAGEAIFGACQPT